MQVVAKLIGSYAKWDSPATGLPRLDISFSWGNEKIPRSKKEHCLYMDETWLDSNLSFEKCWRHEKIGAAIKDSSGHRLIVVYAGSESGFVLNGSEPSRTP
ncbi:hypothetical protein HNY73_007764 [Argiope bruennichi]|uniref:Uncharacterized protein n=1 Tax=Argiope bruennichi TaxID=94029 RepID=A0A8T0FHK5_ARGBR|nr:hypothetical protein HNY73_007764 [Argiope bruennichi]